MGSLLALNTVCPPSIPIDCSPNHVCKFSSRILAQSISQIWDPCLVTSSSRRYVSSFTENLRISVRKRERYTRRAPQLTVKMTAISPFVKSLITAIIYEVGTVWKENLPLLKKVQFAILKVFCLLGVFIGRENPKIVDDNGKTRRKDFLNLNVNKLFRVSEKPHIFESTMKLSWLDSRFALYDAIGRIYQAKDDPLNPKPRIAVVVPVYTDSKTAVENVWDLIESLQKQSFRPYQVILVDDGSPIPWLSRGSRGNHLEDCNRKDVSLEDRCLPAGFTAIFLEKNSGPSLARNCGILEAISTFNVQVICFVDSDCVVGERWVENFAEAHVRMEKGGKVVPVIFSGNTKSFGDSIIDQFHDHFGTLNGRTQIAKPDSLLYGPTCNLSIRVCAKLIQEMGAFDVSFPDASFEDVEFCMRAQKAGFLIRQLPEALVFHKFPKGVLPLFRMFKKYGASEWLLMERHPTYMEAYGSSRHIPSYDTF